MIEKKINFQVVPLLAPIADGVWITMEKEKKREKSGVGRAANVMERIFSKI